MINVGDVLSDFDFLNQAKLQVYIADADGSYVDGIWQEATRSLQEIEAGVQIDSGANQKDAGEGRRYNESINVYLNIQKLNIDRTKPNLLREGDEFIYRSFVWEVQGNDDWFEAGYYVARAVKTDKDVAELQP